MTNSLQYLKEIKERLKKDDYPTELLEAEKSQLPINVLIATVGTDYSERNLYCNFSFYPSEGELTSGDFMQIFCELPNEFTEAQQSIYVLLIPYLNAKLAVGHLGFDFANQKTYMRYSTLYDGKDPNRLEKMSDILGMIVFALRTLQPSLKLIEEGIDNLNEILAEFEKVGQN